MIKLVNILESITENQVTKGDWDKADGEQRVDWLLQIFDDADEAEKHFETEWEDLPNEARDFMRLPESVNEEINTDIVNRNINLLDKAADMAIKNPKGNVVELAKIIKKYISGIRNSIKESVNEAKLTNRDAAAVNKVMIHNPISFDSVVLNKKKDTLIVNYTKFSDRSKLRKVVEKLGYMYDNDGRSTNAPRGVIGVGGTNWMSFIKESVNEGGTIANQAYSFADYFGVPVSLFKGFKFDGTDDIDKLHGLLKGKSSSLKGTENIYNASLKESVNEGLSKLLEKIKGIDGKACWKGYRYAGTKDGKDKCVKVNEEEVDMSINEVMDMEIIDENITEAKFKGKTVTLNKPTRGDSKKFKVYVNSGKKNADGSIKVKKVNFGHGGTSAKKAGQKTMSIRKSNPKARSAFRARHNCDSPGPKTMARYWSCKKW
jgi:hypothetical protein